MDFRLVGPHQHKATLGGDVFFCLRQCVRVETGLAISWTAYRGDEILQADCRTLNAAKNLCRAAARAAPLATDAKKAGRESASPVESDPAERIQRE